MNDKKAIKYVVEGWYYEPRYAYDKWFYNEFDTYKEAQEMYNMLTFRASSLTPSERDERMSSLPYKAFYKCAKVDDGIEIEEVYAEEEVAF